MTASRKKWNCGSRVASLRGLATLPDPQREAITLAYFGGYSQSEIAALVRGAAGHDEDEDAGRLVPPSDGDGGDIVNEQEFVELTAGHALHALSPEDERRFETALAAHPEWQDHVGADAATVAALADSVSEEAPPPSSARRCSRRSRPGRPTTQSTVAAGSTPDPVRRAREAGAGAGSRWRLRSF